MAQSAAALVRDPERHGLLIAERRGRITAVGRARLAGFLQMLPITIDDKTVSRAWPLTAQLAETRRLTAYHATCLELTARMMLPLATTDKSLIASARSSGVKVLPDP